MKRHFHEELKELKELFDMGCRVEAGIENAIAALFQRNETYARQVFEDEKLINRLEIEIDERGHALSALWQPMAGDLRLLAMIFKINTDLERMSDHAVNIAERALLLIPVSFMENNYYLREMSSVAVKMFHNALDAFIREDAALARKVLQCDDTVDDYNDTLYAQLGNVMEQNPRLVQDCMHLVMIGHNLERIADLSGNIAEDVIYLKQGKEVRHHIETSGPSSAPLF